MNPERGRVEPRQLVEEDDLPPTVVELLQERLKHEERLQPALWPPRALHAVPQERVVELLKLVLQRGACAVLHGRQARMPKGDPATERLVHQISLANPAPPVYGNQLGPPAVLKAQELLFLFVAPYHAITSFNSATNTRKSISSHV